VLDALHIDSALLLGCSQGGRIAIDIALAHPGRVRALVLVASAVSGAPPAGAFSDAVQARLDALEAAEAREDTEAANELEAQLWLDGPAQPPGRVGGALRELFLSMNGIALRSESPGNEVAPPPAWPRLHEIGVPTLVLWGPLDFAHLQLRMRHLVDTIAGAQGEVIDGTAHLPNLERPEAFQLVVASFLASLRG
jgi:pimeloyl-ACP methyl ester carboxylesterase